MCMSFGTDELRAQLDILTRVLQARAPAVGATTDDTRQKHLYLCHLDTRFFAHSQQAIVPYIRPEWQRDRVRLLTQVVGNALRRVGVECFTLSVSLDGDLGGNEECTLDCDCVVVMFLFG